MEAAAAPNVLPTQLSSRKRRIAAFMLDYAVLVAVLCIILAVTIIGFDDAPDPSGLLLPGLLIIFLLFFGKDCFNGISIGRWIMGIQVVNAENAETPTKGKLILRNISQVLWPLEFIVLAVSKDKQRLGDLMTNTRVIKNPLQAAKPKRAMALVAVIVIAGAAFSGGIEASLLGSTAYKVSKEYVKNDADVIEATGGVKGFGTFVGGNIKLTGSSGSAILNFTVLGNTSDVDVTVAIVKPADEGNWHVVDMAIN